MKNINLQLFPDWSRMKIGGQLYNCVDSDVKGLFRNSVNGDLVIVKKYTFENNNIFFTKKRQIEEYFFHDVCFTNLSDSEIDELEINAIEKLHLDERLSDVIYPYAYELCKNGDAVELFTLNEVTAGFGNKYKRFENAVTNLNFAINLRLNAIANILDLISALQEKFNGLFHSIDLDSIFVNVETGGIKVLLEQMIEFQADEKKSSLNEVIAYMIFRLLCIGNPYDGKKNLVEFPLLTSITLKRIAQEKKGFIFGSNDNSYSKYASKEVVVRWNALPDFIRNALRDNLDSDRNAIFYELKDWIYLIRKLRDLLVFVKGQFRFCNPLESNKVLFLQIGDYLIPVWERKALYGYHIDKGDFHSSRKVILGVNQEGKLVNHSGTNIDVVVGTNRIPLEAGKAVEPKKGMVICVDGRKISVINMREQ